MKSERRESRVFAHSTGLRLLATMEFSINCIYGVSIAQIFAKPMIQNASGN